MFLVLRVPAAQQETAHDKLFPIFIILYMFFKNLSQFSYSATFYPDVSGTLKKVLHQ